MYVSTSKPRFDKCSEKRVLAMIFPNAAWKTCSKRVNTINRANVTTQDGLSRATVDDSG